mgnify:CR=1 FL=1
MRFGFLLSGGMRPEVPRTLLLEEELAKARAARELGYASLWTGGGYLMRTWHHLTLLARLAAEAPGLELGTVVLLPLHPAPELAEQASTLDVLCGGRLTLAVAQGWRDFQFRAYGVPRRERLGRFLETLEVLRLLWTQDRVTYHGRYLHLEDVPGAAPPARRPHPRLLVAANGDAGVQRAPHIADGWLVSSRATLPTIRHQAALYHEACRQAGAQPHIVAWRECFVARSRQEALETVRPWAAALYADRAALGHGRDLPEADRIDRPFEELVEGRFIIGSPEECVAQIEEYRALGVEEVVLRMQWPGMPPEPVLRSLRRFGEEVLPRFP